MRWPFKPKPIRPPINEDWRVGDLAFCIFEGPWTLGSAGPAIRETVKVTDVYPGVCLQDGALAWGLRFAGYPHGYVSNAFRKLDAPASEIADRIRACRPATEKVPA